MPPKPQFLSAAQAAALAAKLADAEIVPSYPAPPASDIIIELKKLNAQITKNEVPIEIFSVESQSSSIISAAAITLCEKRSFVSAVNLQKEALDIASYMRIPLVIANVSSVSGTDKAIYSHNVLGLSGKFIFMPATNQEVFDSIIQAYSLAENKNVLMPVVINIDVTTYMEHVVPQMKTNLQKLKLPNKISNGVCIGAPVDEKGYTELMLQATKAANNAISIMKKINEQWKTDFYERYFTDDAEYIIVAAGYHAMTVKAAVEKLREMGEKVGLLRPRFFPLQKEEFSKLVGKRIAVIDQSGGILYNKIKKMCACSVFHSYKYINENDVFDIFAALKKQEKEGSIWL
ncbi:MAG: hypothetical protein V1802_00135 [Candidatus Aenigmatarchaeota archaeon]